METIRHEQFGRPVTEPLEYSFDTKEAGLYVIEISARARSKKQTGLDAKSDEMLRVKLDERPFGVPGVFAGTELQNLKKTVLFIVPLASGAHTLSFMPRREPFLEEMTIAFAGKDLSALEIVEAYQAEDGDRRPWLTFVLVDLPLTSLTIEATARWRLRDSDDIKLIVDGIIQRNPRSRYWRDWLWSGSILKKLFQKETTTETIETKLGADTHYVELEADRMPTLHRVLFYFGEVVKRIPSVYDPAWTGDFADDPERMLLARLIFGEARGASQKAKTAVGWTVKNRLLGQWRGKSTYRDVIVDPEQYSAFNLGDRNRPFVENPLRDPGQKGAWRESYAIAEETIAGAIADPTGGANHYFGQDLEPRPAWTHSQAAKFKVHIDNLLFYAYWGEGGGHGGSLKLIAAVGLGIIGLGLGLALAGTYGDFLPAPAVPLKKEYWNAPILTSEEIASFGARTDASIEISRVPLGAIRSNAYGELFFRDADADLGVKDRGNPASDLKFSPRGDRFGYMVNLNIYDKTVPADRKNILRIGETKTRRAREIWHGGFRIPNWEWFSNDAVLLTAGCGTECQWLAVVDVRSGKKTVFNYGVDYTWAPNKKMVLAYHYTLGPGIVIGDTYGNELFRLLRGGAPFSLLDDYTRALWSMDSTSVALLIKKEREAAFELLVFDAKRQFKQVFQKDVVGGKDAITFSWSDGGKRLVWRDQKREGEFLFH